MQQVLKPNELKQKNDAAKAEIDAKEKGFEDAFHAGKLDGQLQDYYHDINVEREAHRKDFQRDFAEELDRIDQPGFQKVVDGYYKIESKDQYGQPGFEVQAAERQAYLDKLSTKVEPGRLHSDRQVMDDYLQWVEGRKSPDRQAYDKYISARKDLGYYDPKLNAMSSGERATYLRDLDKKNPQMDVDNWYWKGGLKGGNVAGDTSVDEHETTNAAPRLNSAQAVQLALQKAPDRQVQLAGLTRPINQTPGSLKMWQDSQKMLTFYLNDVKPQNQEAYAQRIYRKGYSTLTDSQKATVAGRITDDVVTQNPQLNAVLLWWGHGDTFHSYAAATEFETLKKKYGSEPWVIGQPAKPLKFATDAR